MRVPATVLEAARIHLDQPVDVREEDGRIVIELLRPLPYDVEALVAGITDENRHEPIDLGETGGPGGLVMAPGYVPEAGDIVWLQFDPRPDMNRPGTGPPSGGGARPCVQINESAGSYGTNGDYQILEGVEGACWKGNQAKRGFG